MSVFNESPELLEVTLRDGSYLIDFQFTANDTLAIASSLEALGFRWIEVGHGVGLNASACGKGSAAATDEEYMEAAAHAIKTANWGMFFIPGIGRAEDLRLAAKYNMGFVRIGMDITDVQQAQPFIELAKEVGLVVSYNAMKSYAVSPSEFGRCAAMVCSCGADIMCLVDSAGGMFPDDITAYMNAAREHSDIRLGFHGHDNLTLAVANSLRALECGAVLIDSSLQGIGRSGGNASTEIMLSILQQRGFLSCLDVNSVMDFGYGVIRPLLQKRGLDPLAITAGYARFHSSFTAKVKNYAKRYKLDVRDLIVRLCQETYVDAPDELLEQLGRELAGVKMTRIVSIPALVEGKPREAKGLGAIQSLLSEIRPRAIKAGKFSTLNIVIGEETQDEIVVSGNIQSTPTHMIGSVSLTDDTQLISVLHAVDGAVDVIFLDVDPKPHGPDSAAQIARGKLQKSILLTYLDSRVWINAVEDQVVRLLGDVLDDVCIVIAGDHPRSRFLVLRLIERGASVAVLYECGDSAILMHDRIMQYFSFDPPRVQLSYLSVDSPDSLEPLARARLVVVWPENEAWFSASHARHLSSGTYLLDAGIGTILPEGLEEARYRGALLIRVNIWPALAGALSEAHESARICQQSLGWETIAGVPVVAGGAIGKRGDVVVDCVHEPTRVIGVADGLGGVLFQYDDERAEGVKRVSEEISRRLVMPRLNG